MPRRGQIAKRDVLPDPLYNSKLVTRLINNVMYDGKKGVAQKIVYDAFNIINEKTGNDFSISCFIIFLYFDTISSFYSMIIMKQFFSKSRTVSKLAEARKYSIRSPLEDVGT